MEMTNEGTELIERTAGVLFVEDRRRERRRGNTLGEVSHHLLSFIRLVGGREGEMGRERGKKGERVSWVNNGRERERERRRRRRRRRNKASHTTRTAKKTSFASSASGFFSLSPTIFPTTSKAKSMILVPGVYSPKPCLEK